MTKSLTLISPLAPPARGGLADHTWRLALELSQNYQLTLLTSPGAGGSADFRVVPQIGDWRTAPPILGAIEAVARDGPILWQYVPHMYGRGGVNRAVPNVIEALCRRGRRQVVIAHEIAAPLSLWPQRCWYALAQRRQWRHILRTADAIGLSTEAWLERWRRRVPQLSQKFFLCPSPSNIPVAPCTADTRRQLRQTRGWPEGVPILAYFGTLNAAKRFDWVQAAWHAAQRPKRPVALAAIGEGMEAHVPPPLQSLFGPLGFLSAEQVSQWLQLADVLALPFIDGVSERRGTFMAGLAHGCAIVTTVGPNTGASLRHADFMRGVEAPNQAALDRVVSALLEEPASRKAMGAQAREVYEERYSWSRVGSALTAHMTGLAIVNGGDKPRRSGESPDFLAR